MKIKHYFILTSFVPEEGGRGTDLWEGFLNKIKTLKAVWLAYLSIFTFGITEENITK